MILEKLVDGEWCPWGDFDTPDAIAKASFELGRNAGVVDNVRVVPETKRKQEIVMDGQVSIGDYVEHE